MRLTSQAVIGPVAIYLAGVLSLAQTNSSIQRDGVFWAQTETGVIGLGRAVALHVNTDGNLSVRGEAGATGQIRFSLTKRVRGRSMAEAAVLLREFQVRSAGRGSVLHLSVATPKGTGAYSAELAVTVPSGLAHSLLKTNGGNVLAAGLNGDVQAETLAGRIDLDRLGSGAGAKTGGGEVRVGHVAGAVRCFSGGGNISAESCGRESWFETAGGDVQVRECGGTVHASTGGGNIQVGHAAGEVFAHTAGGVIDVLNAAGLVTAATSGGAIQVNTAKGVRCESGAGAIRLRNVGAGALRASTLMGNIVADLMPGSRIEDSLLSTSAGDIIVLIASSIPVTVQARNEMTEGRGIVSEFPEIRVRNAGAGNLIPVLAEGALNGGGPVLRIVASGGTIYLRRQK